MTEPSKHADAHINSIVKQEEEALEQRPTAERLADAVGAFRRKSALSLCFTWGIVIAWLLVNTGRISWAKPFDPWPFSLLGVIFAVEAVILSSFILMRQNRMMRRGERRDHLNLQVDLLAEKEITSNPLTKWSAPSADTRPAKHRGRQRHPRTKQDDLHRIPKPDTGRPPARPIAVSSARLYCDVNLFQQSLQRGQRADGFPGPLLRQPNFIETASSARIPH